MAARPEIGASYTPLGRWRLEDESQKLSALCVLRRGAASGCLLPGAGELRARMARTWLSVTVELLSGHGELERPGFGSCQAKKVHCFHAYRGSNIRYFLVLVDHPMASEFFFRDNDSGFR